MPNADAFTQRKHVEPKGIKKIQKKRGLHAQRRCIYAAKTCRAKRHKKNLKKKNKSPTITKGNEMDSKGTVFLGMKGGEGVLRSLRAVQKEDPRRKN